MAIPAQYREKMGFTTLFRTAFEVYKKGFKPIAIVSASVSIVINLFFSITYISSSSSRITLKEFNQFQGGAELFIGMLATLAVILIALAVIKGEHIAPFTALLQGLKKYPKIIVTTLIMYIGLFLPFIGISLVLSTDFRSVVYNNTFAKILFILLVVAALTYTVYFSVAWVFNFVVVLMRNKWQFKALEHSRLAVKGSWWRTVGMLGIALVIGGICASLTTLAGWLFVRSGFFPVLLLDVAADILTKFPMVLMFVYFLNLEKQKNIVTDEFVFQEGNRKTNATLLAFFLGGFGIHKFYLGQKGLGILYVIFFWTGVPFIIGIIEGIVYLIMSDQKFNEQYGSTE